MASPSWNSGDFATSIEVNQNILSFSACGPDRAQGAPLVIILPGLSSTTLEWVAVVKQLSGFVRTLVYDRPGYAKSIAGPQPAPIRTAAMVAAELDSALQIAGIEPPFVIVCHSFGGLTSREFIELRRPSDIAGMVFVDANSERSEELSFVDRPGVLAMLSGITYHDTVGLSAKHKLSPEEWSAMLQDEQTAAHKASEAAEMAGLPETFKALRAKHQLSRNPPMLGNAPIIVLKGNEAVDFQKLYDAGVKLGNGTEIDRAAMREFIQDLKTKDHPIKEDALKLSSRGRVSVAKNSGHNVQLLEPERIVEEIKWVLSNLDI